jgi:hypothetical protein
MSDERKERTDMQLALLEGELFAEVQSTTQALRSSHDYDHNRWTPEGSLAVLCYALEQSACGTDGTSLTLAGVYSTLALLKRDAKARR